MKPKDIDCELFHSPQNEHIAHDRLKKRLRKHLGANVNRALKIAQKAIMNPELLTSDEKAFHQKVMTSERKFDNA
ncbi:MAG: hypothetical protein ACRBB4_05035 [Neptuniibacter sp.]